MATQAAHQLRAAATGWGQAQQPRVSPPSQAPTQPPNQPTPIPVRSDPSSAAAAPPPAAAAPAVSGSARVSLPSFVLRLLLAMLPPCAGDPSPSLFSAAAAASNRSSPGLMFAHALWTPLPVRARAGGSPGWRAGGPHCLMSCNSHRAMGGIASTDGRLEQVEVMMYGGRVKAWSPGRLGAANARCRLCVGQPPQPLLA